MARRSRQRLDRPEVPQEAPRDGRRDAGDSCEDRLRGWVPSSAGCPHHPMRILAPTCGPSAKPLDPDRRVTWRLAPEQRHTGLDDGQQRSPYTGHGQPSSVEPPTFDQQPRTSALRAQLLQLAPQTARRNRAMQVGYGLSLDQLTGAHDVVPGGQGREGDADTEGLERLGYPRASLPNVNGYRHGRRAHWYKHRYRTAPAL